MSGNERDRPSRHGRIMGQALALIAMAGRRDAPMEMPDMCATCAFREGCFTNQCAGTGVVAMRIVAGVDPDRFACHHGRDADGQPSKLCIGYVAARLAAPSFVHEVLATLKDDLDAAGGEGPDEVRAAFDTWLAKIDPGGKMDDYRRAREYNKHLKETGSDAIQSPEAAETAE